MRIERKQKLLLENLVKQGLPTDFAGKLMGMSSRNSSRIVSQMHQRKSLEADEIKCLPISA